MRKLFSLIAAVLFAGSMMAQVTITPGDFTETTSADFSTVKEGVTVAVTASTVNADQIRIFKGQTITISAESNITSIVFTCTANGTAKYGPGCFSAQTGYTFEAEGKTGTWEGSATSVTFTAETNQVRATQIVVTLAGGDVPPTPQPTDENVVYNWSTVEAEQVGATVLGSAAEVSSVKIHMNEESIPALKFGSSYVYADGKWVAMKPADGFKAGDTIKFAGAFSNDATDGSKYAQIDFYAADQATRLFRSDSVVNGKKTNDDPVVEYFVLEADQDSIFVGRYGNTGLFVTMLKAVRPAGEVVPPTPEDTWTVAGEPTTAFGSSWTPSDASNDMVKQEDGSYKWERTGLELGAGTVKFKVVKNHAWDEAYPAQNYELAIAEAGIYTITITFEPANENNVSAVATKTGEAVVVPTVVMHGQFASNDWADTEAFAKSEDKKTATLKLTLEAKTIEFGMKFDGSWKANGANITREAASTSLAEGSGNMHLVADVAGEYTFTYTYETQVLAVTYPAEAPVITTYEVAEAIAAGLAEDTEIQVRGIITKMEFKGKNFAKYGSVNIYVADATGAEGEFEFFNCYSLNADTFKTSTPAYDATSTAWEQFTEVVDANGNAIHVGDTVIAFGKYTLYNNTVYELKQGCYLVDVKAAPVQPAKEIVLEMNNGMVSNKYLEDYGSTDVILFNIPVTDAGYIEGDGDYLDISIYPEDPNDISGTYTVENEALDIEYTWLQQVAGTDTTEVEFVDGNVVIAIENAQVEEMAAELKVAANLTSVDGDTYIVTFDMVVYYDFIEEEQGIEDVAEDQKKAIKRIETGNVIIEKNGVRYNLNGQQIR